MIQPKFISKYIFFLAIVIQKICSGQNLEIEDSVKRTVLGFEFGPQISMTDGDRNDIMIGPNLMLNALFKNKFLLSLDMHEAITTKWDLFRLHDYTVNHLGSISLLVGYRIYETKKSAFQLQGGFSYGDLYYVGERTYDSGPWIGLGTYYYDDKNLNFGGIAIKASYRHQIKKKVGYEIYISNNLHIHPEIALGINLIVGKMR